MPPVSFPPKASSGQVWTLSIAMFMEGFDSSRGDFNREIIAHLRTGIKNAQSKCQVDHPKSDLAAGETVRPNG